MRNFYVFFCRNIVWIYLSALICFAYGTLLKAIPEQVYMVQGEELSLDEKLPVTISVNVSSGEETLAGVGESTYETILRRQESTCGELTLGEHRLTCFLFGVIPIREVGLTVVKEQKVYASGHVTGIYGKANGVLVLGTGRVENEEGSFVSPSENLLMAGDYITAVNGQAVEKKEELTGLINDEGADPLVLTLIRQEEEIEVSVAAAKSPVESENAYMLGIWVKDDMAGIGTISYYTEDRSFGALGHGITDGQTGELLLMEEGRLYFAEISKINRGVRGNPGELSGVIYYGRTNQIGSVEKNTDTGIYGILEETYFENASRGDTVFPVGYKQEAQTGEALLFSDVSGETQSYSIEIDSLDYGTGSSKGIRFHVTDEALIALTGGIVQGLSGSPIVQNGKLIGAVTHVLVSDPTRGYGIFVENMLNN